MERRPLSLFDGSGCRKYLTQGERKAFLRAAKRVEPDISRFCRTLAYSGCRISEALALTWDRVDTAHGLLIFESLKKRRRGIYRAVPVPPTFINDLRTSRNEDSDASRIWRWSRSTAWRHVCAVMESAGITGNHASPKGLRHGFGVHAVSSGVPLNMLQKWLGHAQISTTAIYADATGPEEKRIAAWMWGADAA